MLPVGLSSCGKTVNESLLDAYRSSGITHMELSMNAKNYAAFDFKATEALAKRYGITLWSLHLPFAPFETYDPSRRALCKATLAYFKELIAKGSAIGIRNFVVHASGEPIAEADRAERMKCAKESMASLAEIADSYGGTVCVEDLPRTCLGRNSSDILELISLNDKLRVCFDTNHLLHEDNADFVRAVGKKIVTTHVSDYDLVDEKHWLPGEGKVDWQALVQALKEAGYNGPWLYEIGFACPNTLWRERDLTCEDFANNAAEIFENRPPHVLSKLKSNNTQP